MGKLFRSRMSFERENFIEKINSFPENTRFFLFIGNKDILLTRSSVPSYRNVNLIAAANELPFFVNRIEIISKVSLMDKLEPEDETYAIVKLRYLDQVYDFSDKNWIDEMDDIDKYFITQELSVNWNYDDQG